MNNEYCHKAVHNYRQLQHAVLLRTGFAITEAIVSLTLLALLISILAPQIVRIGRVQQDQMQTQVQTYALCAVMEHVVMTRRLGKAVDRSLWQQLIPEGYSSDEIELTLKPAETLADAEIIVLNWKNASQSGALKTLVYPGTDNEQTDPDSEVIDREDS